MKNASPTRFAVAVSIALLAALTVAVANALAANVVPAGKANNGKSIIIKRGAQLVVSLKGNASTGYAWKVRSVDRAVLKPFSVTYAPSPNPKHLVGAGGIYKLRFRARANGTTVLRLTYARGKQSAGSFWLRVIVSGG